MTATEATIETGLDALFRRLATVGGVVPASAGSRAVSGIGKAQGQITFPAPSNPTTLDWTIVSVRPNGRGELRADYAGGTFEGAPDPVVIEGDTYVPDPGQPDLRLGGVVYSQHTHTSWTVEVRIESSEQTKPASAHWRALLGRLRLPSAHAELDALGLAYVNADEMADDTYDDEHGRAVSVFIGNLYLNGAEYAEDLPVTTIETSHVDPDVVG